MGRIFATGLIGLAVLCHASIGLGVDFQFIGNKQLTKKSIEEVECQGASQLLVTIFSEPEDNLVHTLSVDINDDGAMEKLTRRSSQSVQEVLASDLLNGFVVMARTTGRDAILLGCPNCTLHDGGIAVFKYLYNGITMSFRSFDMQLIKVNNQWVLLKTDGTPIHTLRLKSRTVFGQVIGISDVLINE